MTSARNAHRAPPAGGDTRPRGRQEGAGVPGAARIAALLASALALAGCAYAPPKPWEKGELAKPAMTFDGSRLEMRYQEHVYQSKEAATGGYGVGGGGCGCN